MNSRSSGRRKIGKGQERKNARLKVTYARGASEEKSEIGNENGSAANVFAFRLDFSPLFTAAKFVFLKKVSVLRSFVFRGRETEGRRWARPLTFQQTLPTNLKPTINGLMD